MGIFHPLQGTIHARQRCGSVSEALVKAGLFENSQNPQWRISPDPFVLTHEEVTFFRQPDSVDPEASRERRPGSGAVP